MTGRGGLILAGIAVAAMIVGSVILFNVHRQVRMQEKSFAESQKPAGIELTLLTASQCKECASLTPIVQHLNTNADVKITKDEAVEYNSDQGKELVLKYKITHVPALLLRGEVFKKDSMKTLLEGAGEMNEDGTYVLRNVPPPYLDLASSVVKGKFTLTVLTDASCKECYDPKVHYAALTSLGMTPSEEKKMDRSTPEGAALIARYAITSVPTIVLIGDVGEYKAFAEVWPQVGTTEKDGARVFRAGQDLMGTYRDLKTGAIKNKKEPQKVSSAPLEDKK